MVKAMNTGSPNRAERRLAAILAADVAGYSRLIGADEEGTLNRLRAIRAEVIDPRIAEHHGRLVKTTGDGLLVEFASVVDALRCASEMQQAMAGRNAGIATAERIDFRIGINVGDVVVEDGDIFGDGVNVAARLETLAEPGGICVSARVQEDAAGRLDLAFEDLGEQQLKNIARPVRVYRVGPPAPSLGPPGRPAGETPAVQSAALPLPDKPSIAVLPFQNMSGDPEQEYFADGMVEEIITALSRIHWLFVIARNSSFTYKGQAVDVRRVGRELGVRYVLEGSVRKGGGRVRITAQLIEVATGAHLWADRFDGLLEEVFELQDEVATSVAGVIEPTLRKAEIERASRKPTANLDAYDLYLRALAESKKGEAGLREAVTLFKTALAIDPSYAAAAGRIALCRLWLRSHGLHVSDEEMAEAGRLAAQAIHLGDDDPEALWMGAHTAAYFSRAYGLAESASERALAMNPNSADAWTARGWVLVFRIRPEPAIEAFQRAIRLSPLDPATYYFESGIAFAYLYMRRFEEAAEWADRSFNRDPRFVPVLRVKLVACAHSGRIEEARYCLRQVLELQPELTVARLTDYPAMTVSPEILGLFSDGFRKAGLPEG
jgi:TolB-like protein/class 3 adenylate cyclase